MGWTRASTWPSDMLADRQQLDAVAEVVGEFDVQSADAGNPLGVDAVKVDLGSKAERDQDGQLVGGIDPLDVKGRVRLGIAQFLGDFEHVGKVGTLLGHAGQDVVAGAVHDADDTAEVVGSHVALDGGQDRDAATDRRLELDLDPFAGRRSVDLVAMQGQQRLVGGNDMLAFFDGLQHKGSWPVHSRRSVR